MQRVLSFSTLLLQLSALCLLLWLCDRLVAWLQWPIPGSVIGLLILVLLLLTRVVPERAVGSGSRWLLGELLLFFIPPVVSVLKYSVLIREDGVMILLTVLLGTIMVLGGTAWVVERVFRFEQHLNEQHRQELHHV